MTAWENPFLWIDSSVFRALPEVQCNGVPVTSEFVSYGESHSANHSGNDSLDRDDMALTGKSSHLSFTLRRKGSGDQCVVPQ